MGAPVVAYCRISTTPIRVREPVTEPDAVIIVDATLLHHVDVFAGLAPGGYVLINSPRSPQDLGSTDLAGRLPPEHVVTVPASEIGARAHRPAAAQHCLLGAFAALTGTVTRESIEIAVQSGSRPRIAAANVAARGQRSMPCPERRAMRKQMEGSRAIAETVARCRPHVVPAYPITPQTHIVEAVGAMVKDGTLAPCEFITVESEFAAMSAAIGASAAGARSYTATASQGLLYMAEALFNASGLGMPIVMTVANRAIGAPINIWNDHSDSMSQRDCGWIQLYAQDNQDAVDLHVLAFRLAEQLSVPVMVCVDGFVLTHAFEPIEVPDQETVDQFLPPYAPRQVLDPDAPLTIGAMVGPEAFTEVRYLAHQYQLVQAEPAFDDLAGELAVPRRASTSRQRRAIASTAPEPSSLPSGR